MTVSHSFAVLSRIESHNTGGEGFMVNIAICAANSNYVYELYSMLRDITDREKIVIHTDIFSSGSFLEKAILKGNDYHILFLDLDSDTVPDTTSDTTTEPGEIITARRLRKYGIKSLIICSSKHDTYFRELFEIEAFRFMDKPVNPEILQKYFLDAIAKIQKENKYFIFKRNRQLHRVQITDILYFESNKRKIILHKINGQRLEFYGKLGDVEKDIRKLEVPFLRTHQSFLVNCNYVFGWKTTKLQLDGGIQIPVSEEQQKRIRRHFTNLIQKDILDETP